MNYELTQILLLPEIHSMGRVLTFLHQLCLRSRAPFNHLLILWRCCTPMSAWYVRTHKDKAERAGIGAPERPELTKE